ncbi:ATP-binding response regulator [Actinomadura madurae]|uniref:ATP-binding response regulator n=2 Tax=Actinomadura madurae TaxID=1993 RepID=UPI0020D23F8E|nr:ATP-binding protein [Actinomadura madurae]MCP9955918.1 ATP-binding protein [Actinomadura madurae]MCP9985225.1 ATP-binding protein [Actinomadura madurae]
MTAWPATCSAWRSWTSTACSPSARPAGHVAAAVGLDHQDQVRVATALSEAGRQLYASAGRVSVAFRLDDGGRPGLVIELDLGRARPDRPPESLDAAARLMTLVEEDRTGDRDRIRLRKDLPASAAPMADEDVAALRVRLRRLRPATALEELRTQNAELLAALEELRNLNAELEATNHGVMALYNEISEELEETNSGVVALHAELEEKSDQLRRAVEVKNRFWANISHELRTPVNGIIGLSRLLLDPAAEPVTPEQRHQIILIGETGGTLLALVDELLDMAKAEQGRLEPRPAPVNVPALLKHLAELMGPMAEQAGLTLSVDVSRAPPVIVTDREMLSRILRNLVGNGLKFTAEGEVRLAAGATSRHTEFVVTDTGVGIPPDEQERVFEEFYQAPGGTARGTGLGLPYARHLATALGGELLLESAEGEGTTVTLRLPPYRPLAELGLGHVLIADDDDATRRLLRGLVEEAAERVSEAADGRAALAAVAADPPGLILLDLRMPGVDGVDVLAELPPEPPVVLVTSADVTVSDDPRLARAGAVLAKDRIGPETLADAVRAALADGTARPRDAGGPA